MRPKKTALALITLCACLVAPAAAQAVPAPAWQLTAVSLPTNFVPGSESNGFAPVYFIIATNVGAAPTTGEVTLTATLPTDITPVSGSVGGSDVNHGLSCKDPVGQTVLCKTNAPLHPGHWLGVSVGVDVDSEASGVLVPKASVVGGGAGETTAATPTPIDTEPAPFELLSFKAPLTEEDGSPAVLAGSHPERLTIDVGFPVEKVNSLRLTATEHPRTVITDLPRGLIINPRATPKRCTEAQLTGTSCPLGSQVGTITIMTVPLGGSQANPVTSPIYNMFPPPGEPALLGFDALNVSIFTHISGEVRSDGDYGISGIADDILARGQNPLLSVQAQLWGDPTSSVHDQIRECPKQATESCPLASGEQLNTAFLTGPTECSGEPPLFRIRARSWEHPDADDWKEASYELSDLEGNPKTMTGCNELEFKPTIDAEPSTNLIDSPAGLDFDLHQPQNFDLDGRSTAALKDALVTLPEGMVANPSQASGLRACSPAQIGLTTPVGVSPAHFNKKSSTCPDASKLGKVVVSTPLLEDPLPDEEGGLGAVYLAEPFENPFGSLIALYIVIEDPETSTIVKLAGEVVLDPESGQISSIFEENPQLPLEDAELEFFEGPRAPLRTPPTCATHTTFADFIPWSAPGGAGAQPSDSFALTGMPGGGGCPTSPELAPHAPAFSAGTLSPQAGAHSPLVVKIGREDGSQEIGGVETILPPGLSAKLAGVATCSEAAIAAAKAREAPELGALELADPSCPAASEVGTVITAAGAGPTPLHVRGRVYLAGPYKGAPLSFVIITPAVAGPFDLGAVVVRAASYINPITGQPRAVTDPLPTILEGVPLDLRTAYLSVDRPQFVLNPTSCDPMAVEGTATSVFGQRAALISPFQVGGCQGLPFKPKLALRLLGGTRRGAHPRLRTILTARPGDANIARATLALPRSEFVDQAHIRTVCTRVQFAADQCPQGSIYGEVKATTPLLDETLEGPVYLRSSDNELPDGVGLLKGPPSRPIEVEGVARIDSVKGGGVRINIDTVPDVPIGKVVITMQGGRKGLFINSRNLCAHTYRATVEMDGQNGKVHDFRPVMKNDCGKRGKARRRGQHR